MTERTLTTALMDVIKLLYPKAVVLKHSDRFSSGIPDLSVSYNGATTWLEVKYVRQGPVWKEIKPIQLITCRSLQRTTGDRCWFVIYYAQVKEIHLRRPSDFSAGIGTPLPSAAWTVKGFDHGIIRKVLEC